MKRLFEKGELCYHEEGLRSALEMTLKSQHPRVHGLQVVVKDGIFAIQYDGDLTSARAAKSLRDSIIKFQ